VTLPNGLTQQDGFLHAGMVTAAMDSACGYAAMSPTGPHFRVTGEEERHVATILTTMFGAEQV